MSLEGKISGGKLPKDLRIFVDPVYGDDATAQKYREDKPFATIQAAANVYLDGEVIEVNGAHTVTATIQLPGNNASHFVFDFIEGSSVTANFPAAVLPLFNADDNVSYEIHGRGTFDNPSTFNPASAAVRVFQTGVNGTIEIYGAKVIRCYSGYAIKSDAWLNIRNVDLLFSLNFNTLNTGYNPARDGMKYGFIENCVFARPDGSGNVQFVSGGASQKIIVNNCSFYGGGNPGAAVTFFGIATNENIFEFNNCRFIAAVAGAGGNNRTIWFNSGYGVTKFNNCYFESLTTYIAPISANHKVTFVDCRMKSVASLCVYRLSNAVVNFEGTNILYAGGSSCIASDLEHPHRVNGTVISNIRPQLVGAQLWRFDGISDTPTPGDTYTITANDGESIVYTVQVADTSLEVCNGLIVEAALKALESVNDFTHYNFTLSGTAGAYDVVCSPSDTDYNYDLPAEQWGFTTSGGDLISVIQPSSTGGFAIVGGEFIIDENLTL